MNSSELLDKLILLCREEFGMDAETESRLRNMVRELGVQSQPDMLRLVGSFWATLGLTTAYREYTQAVRSLALQLEQFPQASVIQHQKHMAEASKVYQGSVINGEAALMRAFKKHDDAFAEKYATKEEFNRILKQLEKLMQIISNSATLGLKGWMLIALLILTFALSFFLGAYFPGMWL